MSSSSASSSSSLGTYKAVQLVTLSKTIESGIAALEIRDLPRSALKPHEIRLQVHASAVNYFDLLMLIGRYQYKPKLPFTLGSEASGVVVEVGSAVKQYKVGDAVITGMTTGGAMAAEMVLPAAAALPKPPLFSHAEAAGLPVGFYTAYHGLVHRGHLQRGQTLLVTGAGGGMGLSSIQLGVKLGATVIAAASSAAKLEQAKALGAHHTINYAEEDLKTRVEQITNKKMVDCAYEIVGGKIFDECVRSMAPNGRLLVIGFASGTIPSVPANLVLVKGFDVVGVRSGAEMQREPKLAREMAQQMAKLTADDRQLAPLVHNAYELGGFKEAYKVVNERAVIGKATVLWQPGAKEIKGAKL